MNIAQSRRKERNARDDASRSRWAAGALVFAFLAWIAGLVWMMAGLHHDAAGHDAPNVAAIATMVGTFEYFPAQYVNTAKEIPEHIRAY